MGCKIPLRLLQHSHDLFHRHPPFFLFEKIIQLTYSELNTYILFVKKREHFGFFCTQTLKYILEIRQEEQSKSTRTVPILL